MSDLKYNKFLGEIIDTAKNLESNTGGQLTADRFLYALLSEIYMLGNNGEDANRVKHILERKGLVPFYAREKLIDYMENSDNQSDDVEYFRFALRMANERAKKEGLDELTVDILLDTMFRNPNQLIEMILSPAESKISHDNTEKRSILAEEGIKLSPKNENITLGGKVKTPREHMASLIDDVRHIRNELQAKVFGQDNAINVFLTGFYQAEMRAMIDKKRKGPRATFLFAGPPGVGKTFLAENVAGLLGRPYMRFDMSEYGNKESDIEFAGSDQVYKHGKPGNVTSFVKDNPKCVLLFDEIEKAHLVVIHLFLQMLDAGRLRDNYTDEEISFKDAIIILTTNAGRQLYEDSDSTDLSMVSRKVVIRALQKDINPITNEPFFPQAICSRFASGNVVMFNHMSVNNLCRIAQKEIQRQVRNYEDEIGFKFDIDENVYTALLFAEGSSADARTIKGRAEKFFNDEMYELLRLVASDKTRAKIRDIDNIKIYLNLDNASEDIHKLFHAENKTKAMIMASPISVGLCESKMPDVDVVGVTDVDEAMAILKNQEIDFVLLDMMYGAIELDSVGLNVADVNSPARLFFKTLRAQQSDLPVYLLENPSTILDEEEKLSFTRQGVRGVFNITMNAEDFSAKTQAIAMELHQQECLKKLARENKLVSFETAQRVSLDGKTAEIEMFDLEMAVVVDSEDSKNVLSDISRPNVRFDEVIGGDDAKKELTYFVEYLKNPKKYMGTGVKAPKGVLLYGPPGTGKTMLAKAMACESNVTFIAAEGNQFLKRFVGEGSEKVHELFKTARKYAPSILFIDEIDAIAKERKGDMGGESDEGTLTAFLTEMDGFVSDPSKPVFVLAATNFDVEPGRPKSLDPALMRRFDRRVYIDLPDKDNRIQFMKLKLSSNKAFVISEEQIENIAMRSTGMSLAEMDSVFELALRSAIREGSTTVTDAILEEALELFNGGEAKKWDKSQLERVARHEAGHAFVCWYGGETPSYLTIVARGDHGGYMQHAEQEGKNIHTRDELLARIRTSLGGRAAEIVYYGEKDGISTGASGDLASATNVARHMLCTYGMDEDFGLAVINGVTDENGILAAEVRGAINVILKEQMEETVRLISENREKVDALVEVLMTKNHLNGAEIDAVLSGMK